jgi:pimeloyl-ACP methyl ester carboxylesterase
MTSTDNGRVITKSERYREILTVLARHGIGIVDAEFIKHEAGDQARAEHLRRACEELGTMFVKIGHLSIFQGRKLLNNFMLQMPRLIIAIAALLLGTLLPVVAFASSRSSLLANGDHIGTVFGTRLWYSVAGHGPPLFVVSTQYGIGTSYLRHSLTPLEKHFTLVYVDLRGNGNSEVPGDLTTISTRTDVSDLEQLRRLWGLEKLAILGHSGGGAVALGYAETYPSHVSAIVLVDTEVIDLYPSPGTDRFRAKWRNDPAHAFAVQHYDDPVDNEEELNAYFHSTFAWYLADPAKYLGQLRRIQEGTVIPWQVFSSWLANDKRDAWKQSTEFPNVMSPTLILVGRQDAECPVEIADAAHQGIRSSEEVIFENSGHFPWLEEKQKFFATIEGFLRRTHI